MARNFLMRPVVEEPDLEAPRKPGILKTSKSRLQSTTHALPMPPLATMGPGAGAHAEGSQLSLLRAQSRAQHPPTISEGDILLDLVETNSAVSALIPRNGSEVSAMLPVGDVRDLMQLSRSEVSDSLLLRDMCAETPRLGSFPHCFLRALDGSRQRWYSTERNSVSITQSLPRHTTELSLVLMSECQRAEFFAMHGPKPALSIWLCGAG